MNYENMTTWEVVANLRQMTGLDHTGSMAHIAANRIEELVDARWRPIETAPKDGTVIMAFAPGWYPQPAIVEYVNGRWRLWQTGDAFQHRLTHWAPCPAPPSN